MAKLTDSQLIVLSAAATREDGLATTPAKMTKAAAAKVGSSLVVRKPMREVKAKPGIPVWRHDEDWHPISLMITKAGQKAIGVEEADAVVEVTGDKKRNGAKQTTARAPRKQAEQRTAQPDPIATPRGDSKQALVISMLSGKSGATLDGGDGQAAAHDASGAHGLAQEGVCGRAHAGEGCVRLPHRRPGVRQVSVIMPRSMRTPRPARQPAKTVEEQVVRTGAMNIGELRHLWKESYGSEPPASFSKVPLARAIAYRLPEAAYGGLSPVSAAC